MKPTNYHLFDFLDFDPDLSRDESLWKAYKPAAVYEKDGDICISVPFQKQVLSNDMAPDTAFPREEYTLVIRQYTSGITRLFIGFGEESMTDQSEMLQFSDRIKKLPLQVTQVEGEWIISTQDGIQRALINIKPPVLDRWSELLPDPQETLDLRLYPDGKREIRLAAYDHFSPPRYDALPLAFCKRNGMKERATLSFESKPDECFAGTGERFAKMDLSGQTFFLKNQDGQGVNNRRTYKNIPFYLSSRMYGTFYHTCAHSKLSLAGQSTRSVQFLSDQAMLDVFIIAGNTMEEILRGYRDLTGYPSMPPLWSFGIWMSRMTYFSADEVNEICDRMRAEHYPCDVIHLDTGWFKTDWLCEWKFNEERNLYALLYQKAAYEITKDVTGDGIVWARSAWAGCQRYPLHWGGDSCSSWDGMAGSLKGGLHFGLSGFAFWSHDVPGFHTLPNFMNSVVADDVYMRWTQFGVFSSHIRYHGTNKREPWHYPAIAPIIKKWWKLRYTLIPYIIAQSRKAISSGAPLLQALIFHHPEDKLCWHIDDEYYFGNDFLVAPVMNSENRRDVYLPEGQWVNFFTGEVLEGGRWLKDLDVPLDEMPVYVRQGATIPVYPDEVECTDEMDLSKSAELHIDNHFKGIFKD